MLTNPPIGPRWTKVIRDLWGYKARTILVVLAISVGVFAFGGMFIARKVLIENMNAAYAATNPYTISVILEPFNESLLRTVRTHPDVVEVEAFSRGSAQVWNGTSWSMLNLEAAPTFEDRTINRIGLEAGTLQPGRREILIERQSLPLIDGAEVGGTVLVELPDNTQRELKIVGVVHDMSSGAANITRMVEGYVSMETMRQLGLEENYTQLRIVADPSLETYAELEAAADDIADRLERQGYGVRSTYVQMPGEHWAADLIEAVLTLLMGLGLLSLGLSSFLVINTVTAILSQQKRQIGMMKAVGAKGGDVMGIYLGMASVFGVLALVIALPAGVGLSYAIIHLLASFLNLDIVHFNVPGWVFLLQTLAALITPLIVAMIPILKGMKTTVREAISDYGITDMPRRKGRRAEKRRARKREKGGLVWRLTRDVKLPRPILLSLRNTFRRKMRLILTLATLSTAGLLFLSVMNGRASLYKEFDIFEKMFGFDIEIALTEPQFADRLRREGMMVEGVEQIEGWGYASATIIRPPEALEESDDVSTEEGTRFTILGVPPDTQLIEPTVTEGRWYELGESDVVVLSQEIINKEPYIKVGDVLKLEINDKPHKVTVVGIVNVVGMTYAYAPFDYVTQLQGVPGRSFMSLVKTTSDKPKEQEKVARAVEEHYQQIGIGVEQSITIASMIGIVTGMIDFFLYFMVLMAILLGIVGGLGLASTMSLNVLERTREIGVMRAIGASGRSMRGIFLSEGVLIALFSYVISCVLSLPASYGFSYFAGQAFFDRPLNLILDPMGYTLWLVVACLLAAVASLLPARRAARISVREALAYE